MGSWQLSYVRARDRWLTSPTRSSRLADRGYMPALWLPGGQHFLSPDGHRVVTLDQALAEMDAEKLKPVVRAEVRVAFRSKGAKS
jgi:hypothetical protein